MDGIKRAVLVSEVGWKGMREFAVFLSAKGAHCDILIKGIVPREVLAIITPHKGIKIMPCHRLLFIMRLAAMILGSASGAGSTEFFFSKEKTARCFMPLLKLAGARARVLLDTKEGYEVSGYIR